MPGGVEPQILRLVDKPRAVLEGDDLDRMAAIVRIGKFAFDLGDMARRCGLQKISADRRQIGSKPQDEFARGIDPLPREQAISRNSTGLSSNRRRKPPACMSATN